MALKASKLKVGDTHSERVVEDLTRTQIVQYAGASGDYNPIHTDEIFATQVAGYPSVFAHGMLTMGLAGKMLTNYVGDARLTKFGARFTRQVWPGDTLHGRGSDRTGWGEAGRADHIDRQPGRRRGAQRHCGSPDRRLIPAAVNLDAWRRRCASFARRRPG
jgi:hypothetical protein